MKLNITPNGSKHDLTLEGLTKAQIAFIRCMLQIDCEVDPVEEWGFKKRDGDLLTFGANLAEELEKLGY